MDVTGLAFEFLNELINGLSRAVYARFIENLIEGLMIKF